MKGTYTPLQSTGLAVLIAAVIWSNVAVSKMAKLVKVRWYIKSDRASWEAIRKYRKEYGNGPLFWNFMAALGLAGIGAVMFIFSRDFLNKF